MKGELLVFMVLIAIGSCTEKNGENSGETTDENLREMKEYDLEVGIPRIKMVKNTI